MPCRTSSTLSKIINSRGKLERPAPASRDIRSSARGVAPVSMIEISLEIRAVLDGKNSDRTAALPPWDSRMGRPAAWKKVTPQPNAVREHCVRAEADDRPSVRVPALNRLSELTPIPHQKMIRNQNLLKYGRSLIANMLMYWDAHRMPFGCNTLELKDC
jgi:hypothetical protein